MRAVLFALVVVGTGCTSKLGDDSTPGDDTGSNPGSDPGSDPGSGSDNPANETAKQFCVSETNRYRQMDGHGPDLTESSQLEAYADAGAMHDFSTSPHDHFISTNGGGFAFAENECPQQGNWNLSFGNGDVKMTVGACVQAFYEEGPGGGHYENMMGNYGTLGCGIYIEGQKLTIVQDYGQ